MDSLASYIKPFAIADGGRTEFSTQEIPVIIMDKQQLHIITISLAMFVYSHYWEWKLKSIQLINVS